MRHASVLRTASVDSYGVLIMYTAVLCRYVHTVGANGYFEACCNQLMKALMHQTIPECRNDPPSRPRRRGWGLAVFSSFGPMQHFEMDHSGLSIAGCEGRQRARWIGGPQSVSVAGSMTEQGSGCTLCDFSAPGYPDKPDPYPCSAVLLTTGDRSLQSLHVPAQANARQARPSKETTGGPTRTYRFV